MRTDEEPDASPECCRHHWWTTDEVHPGAGGHHLIPATSPHQTVSLTDDRRSTSRTPASVAQLHEHAARHQLERVPDPGRPPFLVDAGHRDRARATARTPNRSAPGLSACPLMNLPDALSRTDGVPYIGVEMPRGCSSRPSVATEVDHRAIDDSFLTPADLTEASRLPPRTRGQSHREGPARARSAEATGVHTRGGAPRDRGNLTHTDLLPRRRVRRRGPHRRDRRRPLRRG